ncbi:MAG: signal peptidase II [Acidimicrobiia bacterium]
MRGQVQLIRRYSFALGTAAIIVVADLITKRYASIHFVDSPVEVIPGFLTFTFLENPGGAFSLFQNGGQIIGVAAIGVTLFVLAALRASRPALEVVALGMVIGGAVGNLLDRIFRGVGFLDGPVIDWIDLWWIPTFNIADASVTVAVALLVLHAWRTR